MTTNTQLASHLCELEGQQKYLRVTLATSAELSGFETEVAKCHENVDRWVRIYPTHRARHGWLITAQHYFVKHTVVEVGEVLLDITPRFGFDAQKLCHFILHDEKWGDFASRPAVINSLVYQMQMTPSLGANDGEAIR